MPIPLIIDTDMANDDWMAILYLLQSPAVAVQAIAVAAAGEAHRGPGIRTALRLLALAGRPDIPVAGGRKKPLRGRHAFPLIWRLSMDLRLGLSLPKARARPDSRSAVALLTELIMAGPDKLSLLALGPLTNLAEAVLACPALVDQVEMVYIMGGAVHVPGNLQAPGVKLDNQTAEWNIYVDPYAAEVVFQSGLPITLVPLDATNQTPITLDFYRRCQARRETPAAEFVYRILHRLKSFIASGEFYFWDPLAAVVATHPDIATVEQQPLTVIQAAGPECGRTAISQTGRPIQVCLQADQARFEAIFWDTLNNH